MRNEFAHLRHEASCVKLHVLTLRLLFRSCPLSAFWNSLQIHGRRVPFPSPKCNDLWDLTVNPNTLSFDTLTEPKWRICRVTVYSATLNISFPSSNSQILYEPLDEEFHLITPNHILVTWALRFSTRVLKRDRAANLRRFLRAWRSWRV